MKLCKTLFANTETFYCRMTTSGDISNATQTFATSQQNSSVAGVRFTLLRIAQLVQWLATGKTTEVRFPPASTSFILSTIVSKPTLGPTNLTWSSTWLESEVHLSSLPGHEVENVCGAVPPLTHRLTKGNGKVKIKFSPW